MSSVSIRHLNEFHLALGDALTKWQHVETGLYLVTHCLLATQPALSATVFFHIESARSKVSLTDKLCQRCLPQRVYQGPWRQLRKDISKANDIRNGLAHFDAAEIDINDLPPATTAYPFVLSPNFHDSTAAAIGGDGTVKGLYVETLHKAAAEFRRLARGLIEFVPDHIPDWQRRAEGLPPATRHLLETIRSAPSP